MKRVGIVGLGYVGITSAVALARKGCTCSAAIEFRRVVEALAAAAAAHLYEPGIAEGLREHLNERLHVAAVLPDTPLDAVVLCVSTPVDDRDAPSRSRGAPKRGARGRRRRRSGHPRGRAQHRPGRRQPRGGPAGAPGGLGPRASGDVPGANHPGPGVARAGGAAAGGRRAGRASSEQAELLFALLAPRIVRVSSLEAAEAVKLINNCHTDLIYSFGNEVALLRRTALARSDGADPRGESRLSSARSRPPGVRRRRLPVEGSVHPDGERRDGGPRAVVRSATRDGSTSTCRCTSRGDSSSCLPRSGGRLDGARDRAARLRVQGLAADRRHARRAGRADARRPAPGSR